MSRRDQRHVGHDEPPLVPTPLTTDGPQPWHDVAVHLREEHGYTIREIARELGKGFGSVQRFFNPESKAKAKARQLVREKERRAEDPEYAERSRSYLRRYMRHRAPERRKPD